MSGARAAEEGTVRVGHLQAERGRGRGGPGKRGPERGRCVKGRSNA